MEPVWNSVVKTRMTDRPLELLPDAALVVIDVQQGFEDAGFWGRRNNLDAERNIATLVAAWERTDRPIVLVGHDSVTPGSPLTVGGDGTSVCCQTTARMAGNLCYDVLFALDATHSFDLLGPDGSSTTAEDLARATATNLHGSLFARVVTTSDLTTAA